MRLQVSQRRLVVLILIAICLGLVAAVVSQLLTHLIGLVTHIAYFGTFDSGLASPKNHRLGLWAIGVPIIGGLMVGVMARFGSAAIRGHGIPEAMEQVLLNESRIPARLIFLKPLSAALAIGTGGPFGAEGPIIATGGALGSFLGQILKTTADERKVLLCSGAAAGMAATFATPVAATLLAIELLLFEFRPRSTMVVALASVAATGARYAWVGNAPAFQVPPVAMASPMALSLYVLLGCVLGIAGVIIVWAVYAVEDAFDHLPIHWMWWPAFGGLAVGLLGVIEPRSLGVGYENIEGIISGQIAGTALIVLVVVKLASWLISLGSGTSGGTLAPLLTIGAGAGALLAHLCPTVDPAMAAIVGMAAVFASASRAVLASVVFACEATGQLSALLPLLGCCSAAYVVAQALQRNSIMTEKLVRRGTHVPSEYVFDPRAGVRAIEAATTQVVTIPGRVTLDSARALMEASSHYAYPVVDDAGRALGVLTRREIEAAGETLVKDLMQHAPIAVRESDSLAQAMQLMARHHVGRILVVTDDGSGKLVGLLCRSDVLGAGVVR